jgi:hypothetical protein
MRCANCGGTLPGECVCRKVRFDPPEAGSGPAMLVCQHEKLPTEFTQFDDLTTAAAAIRRPCQHAQCEGHHVLVWATPGRVHVLRGDKPTKGRT